MSKDTILARITECILTYDQEKMASLAKEALNARIDPLEIIEKGLAKGLKEVGERFGNGEIFICELVMAAETAKTGMNIVRPTIAKKTQIRLGTVVIGTVEGDIHDLGKNLVASLLEVGGFEVHDLGVDVPADKFIEKVKEVEADILGMSALLTTTIPRMQDVIEALRKTKLPKKVFVIVGGAAVTPNYARGIGADGYAEDAIGAVRVAKELIGKKQGNK